MSDQHVIMTPSAPAAIGPYVQAIQARGMLFVSGQIPLDAATGILIDGDIRAQTHQVLQNLRAIVEAGGSELAYVVKTTIFLTNMADFPIVNEVYAEYFSSNPPARATVGVAALPKGALIEIDAIALVPSN